MDEILKVRLAEVRRTLERASLTRLRPLREADSQEHDRNWITVLNLPDLEQQIIDVFKNSWGFLESQFKLESERIVDKLKELEESAAQPSEIAAAEGAPGEKEQAEPAQLWKKYGELERRAENLLGEIVELLGGLALRDRSVDPGFFAITDQLVGWYVEEARDSLGVLTVPIARAVARTMVQIVGLRFPEWSIWALPLTAYEFAYQYLEGGRSPTKVRDMLKEKFGNADFNAGGRQRVLLADAFATFTTGPAYLFAALNLRLSREDADRAVVIFRILEGLDDKDKTFEDEFLRDFRAKWESSPASGDAPDAASKVQLERFADAALKALKMAYPTQYSVGNWQEAKRVRMEWEQTASLASVPLQPPDKIARLKLIDVLNAAWLSREKGTADSKRLEEAARSLCRRIIEAQRSAGRGTQPPQPAGPAQPGGGQ